MPLLQNELVSDIIRKWNGKGKESRKVLINVLRGSWRRREAREVREEGKSRKRRERD